MRSPVLKTTSAGMPAFSSAASRSQTSVDTSGDCSASPASAGRDAGASGDGLGGGEGHDGDPDEAGETALVRLAADAVFLVDNQVRSYARWADRPTPPGASAPVTIPQAPQVFRFARLPSNSP